ncbi:MAG: LLM class flavin-dependent oxidoreductase [Candidatus Binatia bacterium]
MKSIIAMIENYKFSNDPRELGIAGLAATARKVGEMGFDWILTAETRGHDSFFPLLIAAEHTRHVTLHTGIAVSFPRSPMVTAQMAWDLQRFSRGRFCLGLGTLVKAHDERHYGDVITTISFPRTSPCTRPRTRSERGRLASCSTPACRHGCRHQEATR